MKERMTAGSMRKRPTSQRAAFATHVFSARGNELLRGRAFGELEIDMDDVSMSASDVLDLMKCIS
jgi:hypothetical protein